jgi:hypothetical protein
MIEMIDLFGKFSLFRSFKSVYRNYLKIKIRSDRVWVQISESHLRKEFSANKKQRKKNKRKTF